MSRKAFRTALIVVLVTLGIALLVAGWFGYQLWQYPDTRHGGRGAEIAVTIDRGMSFPQVAARLAQKGVIDRPSWFRFYAMRRGATTAVKTGDYVFKDNMTPHQVLDLLISGVKQETVAVTLPEGKNMLELFDLLEGKREPGEPPGPLIAKRSELEALARDPEFLAKHGISGDSVDGYLFPDTYKFVAPTPARKVLEILIETHRKNWNELAREHGKSAAKLKDKLQWSDRDLLVLASIVEKEAVDPKERPTISQVFVNRLTSPTFKPKKLETDPTIRYGCLVSPKPSAACVAWNEPCRTQGKPDGCDRLHRAQLDDVDNLYNTYQHEGLPPGPIGNPGRASMEAAMQPDGSDYFFFVAKDARTHQFSKTIEEHERAVDKYMK
jgi:UPF0755 protein